MIEGGQPDNLSQAKSGKNSVVGASVKKGGEKVKRLGYDGGNLRLVSFGEDRWWKVVGGLEMRRLSLDSARRVWDQSHAPKAVIGSRSVLSGSRLKEAPSSLMNLKAVTNNKDCLRKDLLLKFHVTSCVRY